MKGGSVSKFVLEKRQMSHVGLSNFSYRNNLRTEFIGFKFPTQHLNYYYLAGKALNRNSKENCRTKVDVEKQIKVFVP